MLTAEKYILFWIISKKIVAENREFKYELSIACGFASHAKNKNLTIDELIQTVDKKNVYRKRELS